MCGITAWSRRTAATKDDLETVVAIHDQLGFTRGEDSWGIAAYKDGMVKGGRGIGPIREPCYQTYGDSNPERPVDAMRRVIGPGWKALLGHNRLATRGDIVVANAHPFVEGEWAFVHNGTIHQKIPYGVNRNPKGNTDSEQAFLYLLDAVDEGHHPMEALEALYGMPGRTNIIAMHRNDLYVLAGDSLYTTEANGTRIYSSEPVNAKPYATQLEWNRMRPGTIQHVNEGETKVSQATHVTKPTATRKTRMINLDDWDYKDFTGWTKQ